MMKAVLQALRILVVIQITSKVHCQNGFNDRDMLRLQQMAANDGPVETITSYSTNIIQRDPNSQSISSVSVQYHMTDPEKSEDYNRADRGRSRKIYRIKNPFEHQENGAQQDTNTEAQDSGTGASNQYAAMQYSLPPEEFLQQMRAENQYYQQQASTPAPNYGYTATPQPQYQYSTSAPNFDNSNQPSNQMAQLEPKMSQSQTYFSNPNTYQFTGTNSYNLDNIQSTPSSLSAHLSTPLPNNPFVGTQTSAYVSSSSPIYISSPPNLQQYVSSPMSTIQASSPDYSNGRITSTIGSTALNYNNNDMHKKMLIDHYDNSAHGVRYPVGMQQQNDYPSSTPVPSSSPYSDSGHESWQSSLNGVSNSVSKSLQEMSLTQYQNYPYNNMNQHDVRNDPNTDSLNSDTHRVGNTPAANNLYFNYAQPEYSLNNLKGRNREMEQENQPYYSHGDYGWKLTNKKPAENYAYGSYGRYQVPGQSTALQATPNAAVSQISFHMDTGKPHTYEQVSKSTPDNLEAQEFARAAAKAQERQQQQQQLYGQNYPSSYNNNPLTSALSGVYSNNDKQRSRYPENLSSNSYPYSNTQSDLITASPYYYMNSKENNIDAKSKQPFDHDKALKNIVPIDVSNVVANSDSQLKSGIGLDNNNRYNVPNFGRDQVEQNLKQYYRSVTDAYFKDKNSLYGFNIKSKPDDLLTSDNNKQLDQNIPYYAKQQQTQEASYSQGNYHDNKRYLDGATSSLNYIPTPNSNNYPDNLQSSVNLQPQGLQRQQNQISADISNIFKLNDIPYRLTSGLTEGDSLRLHNNFDPGVIPTPIPGRLNQNVGSHQIDVSVLNKLLNKQVNPNINRPEVDQASGLISTINGFRVANPFNVDLKLVADMLKGKPLNDESHLMPLRDQFSKTLPLKLDISQLQQLLLKNENNGNYPQLNDGLSGLVNPYLDLYNPGRSPYQGVKYSRSQEEEESIIPIADASNNHPIGAVVEQIDDEREVSTGSDITAQDDESNNFENRPKNTFITGHRIGGDRHRHPNSLIGHHTHHRKYPKLDSGEPYPLLKPPPPQRSRGARNKEKNGRRRRVNKPKIVRVMKAEPLYEAGIEVEEEEATVPTLLRPPPPIADAKVDVVHDEEGS